MHRTIMVLGVGNVGTHVVDMLARRDDSPRIVLAGRDDEYLQRRANLATLVAAQLGYNPVIETVHVDVNDVPRMAETIAAVRPDIIFSTVSLQAWWVIGELPKPVYEELDQAEIGPWLPMQLTLIHKVMKAVKESGTAPKVVNAALPDATHAILDKVGLAPTIGIGNVANIIPALRRAAALELAVAPGRVRVRFITEAYVSHRIPRHADAGTAPYHLSVELDGVDVSGKLSDKALFALVATRFRRLGGSNGAVLTSASAITVIDGLLTPKDTVTHAPGPLGLIGGYPVKVTSEAVVLDLPDSITSHDAEKLNTECLEHDGIQEIRSDGSVRYTERHMEIMNRMIGYSRESMSLDESEDCAGELAKKYAEFRSRQGA